MPHSDHRTAGVAFAPCDGVFLCGMPGQELNRRLIAVKDGRAYRLTFMPDDRGLVDADGQMEALYDLVVKSFRFLP